MSVRAMPACAAVALAIGVAACGGPHQPRPGTVRDEAMRAGVAPEDLVRPTPDYFRDMDFNVVDGRRPTFTRRTSRAGTCGSSGPAATIGCGTG